MFYKQIHDIPLDQIVSDSAQMTIEVYENYILLSLGDLRTAGIHEFLKHISLLGDLMKENKCSKLLLNIYSMKNYDISTRAALLTQLNKLLIAKARYLILAVIKNPNLLENVSVQSDIDVAMKIYPRFVASLLFDNRETAVKWLDIYQIHDYTVNPNNK